MPRPDENPSDTNENMKLHFLTIFFIAMYDTNNWKESVILPTRTCKKNGSRLNYRGLAR